MSEKRKQLFHQLQLQDREIQVSKATVENLEKHYRLARDMADEMKRDYETAHAEMERLCELNQELIKRINEMDEVNK